MRVRMVPFASISERLFRVARQTAKEIDKRVNLDIRGGARRNRPQRAGTNGRAVRAPAAQRHRARHRSRAPARWRRGKNETGELLVQVSQQGNEVVIQFTDDGAGLDLERIRAKAREQAAWCGTAPRVRRRSCAN